MSRPTGFLLEAAPRDPCGAGPLKLPGSAPLARAFLIPHAEHGAELDQGNAPFCAANIMARGVELRMLIQGTVDAKRPSRAWLAFYGRLELEGGNKEAMGLTGMRFSDLARAMTEFGYPSEEWEPYEVDAIVADPHREPSAVARLHAYDQRGKVTLHPIADEDLEGHLAAGHPVVVGFEIDAAYHVAAVDNPWELREHTGDYHANLCVGFVRAGATEQEVFGVAARLGVPPSALANLPEDHVILQNCWGRSYGTGGFLLTPRRTLDPDLGTWAIEWVASYSETLAS